MDRIRQKLLRAARVASLVWLALSTLTARADEERSLEQQVKAAVLLNFARFTSWPADRFETPLAPLEVCVIGSDGLREVTARTLDSKSVRDRRLHVFQPRTAAELQRCHIAYFAQGVGGPDLDRRLAEATGHAVLTVHEQAQARPDAIARFYLEDRKLRFEINAAAAERERLQISAKLLGVAQVVDR
jgi:hypothetical protein